MPTLVKIFLLAMTPIGELRAAIPYGVASGIHPLLVYTIAVIGNMIPVFFLLPIFSALEKLMAHNAAMPPKQARGKNAYSALMALYAAWRERTKKRHSKKFERLGALALIFFVAIPFPFTGAWSGALAAAIFGIPLKKSALLIFIGVLIAGIIVGAISVGLF